MATKKRHYTTYQKVLRWLKSHTQRNKKRTRKNGK